MKKTIGCYILLLMVFLSACQTKEVIEETTKQSIELEATTELFYYEGTKEADAIAVTKEGYFYTINCMTNVEDSVMGWCD